MTGFRSSFWDDDKPQLFVSDPEEDAKHERAYLEELKARQRREYERQLEAYQAEQIRLDNLRYDRIGWGRYRD